MCVCKEKHPDYGMVCKERNKGKFVGINVPIPVNQGTGREMGKLGNESPSMA